eukprot:3384835-Lingulodinium_polyedra.AAC.1
MGHVMDTLNQCFPPWAFTFTLAELAAVVPDAQARLKLDKLISPKSCSIWGMAPSKTFIGKAWQGFATARWQFAGFRK